MPDDELTRRETTDAALALDEWAARKSPPRKKRAYMDKASRARCAEEAVAMMREGWANAKPSHLVALYCWCHEKVYGVAVRDLESGARYVSAAAHAKRAITELGTIDEVVSFVRWTWQREAYKRKRAEERGQTYDFRITWRYQFSIQLMTDYRVFRAQQKGL